MLLHFVAVTFTAMAITLNNLAKVVLKVLRIDLKLKNTFSPITLACVKLFLF